MAWRPQVVEIAVRESYKHVSSTKKNDSVEKSVMKKLLINVGYLVIAVPAFVVILTVWGVTNFLGLEKETPAATLPKCETPKAPAAEERGSWRSVFLPFVRSTG